MMLSQMETKKMDVLFSRILFTIPLETEIKFSQMIYTQLNTALAQLLSYELFSMQLDIYWRM